MPLAPQKHPDTEVDILWSEDYLEIVCDIQSALVVEVLKGGGAIRF